MSEDSLTLLFMGIGALGAGLVSFTVFTQQAAAWLIGHHLLVPTEAAVIPLAGGAGLDWPRILIPGGLLLLLGCSAGWRYARRRAVPPVIAP